MPVLFVVLMIVVLLLVIFLFNIFLLPGMALFNHLADEKYKADENTLLTGTLTTAIESPEKTGEVMTTFATEARKAMPARIYTPNKDNITRLDKGASVLIVETKEGIAYVIPYQETFN